MKKTEIDLSKEQFVQEHFKTKEITNLRELTIGREKKIKGYIRDIQNGVINFCVNMNDMQNENNFFDMKMNNQFKFNECVDKTGNKIKNDFSDIERLYVKCKNSCFEKFPQSKDSLDNYIEKSNNRLKPNLNPCVSECIQLFNGLHYRYHDYIIKSN
jgi:hypothetical protein